MIFLRKGRRTDKQGQGIVQIASLAIEINPSFTIAHILYREAEHGSIIGSKERSKPGERAAGPMVGLQSKEIYHAVESQPKFEAGCSLGLFTFSEQWA